MVLSMDRWIGKIAVVTGASAGIGAAIAASLVENGLIVVGLARRSEQVQALSKKLANKKGKLYAFKADVCKEEDLLKAFKWIAENVGPISILINNAGALKPTTLLDGDIEMWKTVINTNILGLCIATREAAKSMRAAKIDGHIIHINSIGGHTVPPVPGANVYPGTKHAVTALTEVLRQELNAIGSKIRITSVSPGAVDTAMIRSSNLDNKLAEALRDVPKLESEDVANSVVYVLSTPPHVQIHELTIKPVGEAF